jgi:hypothetical protein
MHLLLQLFSCFANLKTHINWLILKQYLVLMVLKVQSLSIWFVSQKSCPLKWGGHSFHRNIIIFFFLKISLLVLINLIHCPKHISRYNSRFSLILID